MNAFHAMLIEITRTNLRLAQAELDAGADFDAAMRALHHVETAERCLGTIADEIEPNDEAANETA